MKFKIFVVLVVISVVVVGFVFVDLVILDFSYCIGLYVVGGILFLDGY